MCDTVDVDIAIDDTIATTTPLLVVVVDDGDDVVVDVDELAFVPLPSLRLLLSDA
jgi:hypothetical protein